MTGAKTHNYRVRGIDYRAWIDAGGDGDAPALVIEIWNGDGWRFVDLSPAPDGAKVARGADVKRRLRHLAGQKSYQNAVAQIVKS